MPAYALGIATPLLLGRLSGVHALTPRMFNLPVSDLAGPQHPLYLDGAPVRAIYPMLPLILVPSLGVAANTFDLMPVRSLARYMAARGFRTYLIDWGKS